ncbi:MAG: hypothetical protein R3A47_09055 [Polyangiales bacterium]
MKRASVDHLNGLASLHRIKDPDERRTVWRQSIATLATALLDQRKHVPLEGFNPDSLLRSMRVATADGLLESIDWLSKPATAAAIYEIAAALPASDVKREFGRWVATQMQQGDAETFVALATQLALGGPKALNSPPIRARMALSLALPLSSRLQADALALALISRKDVCEKWLIEPSTASLPERRLAARLLERAARESVKRAAEGDDGGIRVFNTPEVREVWDRLLGDRESLVWRHVASARGLLSVTMPRLHSEIRRHLHPDLSITEWRRAAASLGASITFDPESAANECRDLLASDIVQRDNQLPASIVIGLPMAAESQPEITLELLNDLSVQIDTGFAEAFLDLRRETGKSFARTVALTIREKLIDDLRSEPTADDGSIALRHALIAELDDDGTDLHQGIADALHAFATEGTAAAHAIAARVLEDAAQTLEMLEFVDESSEKSRRAAFVALRQLDRALFAEASLSYLIELPQTEWDGDDHRLGDLYQRATNWLVIREGDASHDEDSADAFNTQLAQLRTLLHLVDADGPSVDDRPTVVRQRRLLVAQVLFERVRNDRTKRLRRALCASTARASDALIREEHAEVSDLLLAACMNLSDPADMRTLSEASMVPEIKKVFDSVAKLSDATQNLRDSRSISTALDALTNCANDLPAASSPRVEALRTSMTSLARSLKTIHRCNSLLELGELDEGVPLQSLEETIQLLSQLITGAHRRLGHVVRNDAHATASLGIRMVGLELERALRASISELDQATAAAEKAVRSEMPFVLATLINKTLNRVKDLPIDAPRRTHQTALPPALRDAPMPRWVPASRILGGFHVLRGLGVGGVGSVFIARRVEERDNDDAELFALKVPDYSGARLVRSPKNSFYACFAKKRAHSCSCPNIQTSRAS